MLTILRTILRRLALPALLFPAIATGAPVAAADSVANSAHGTVLVFTRTLGWRHDSIPEAVRTLRELAEKAAGEPIPFGDSDLYAEVVDGALDAAAERDALAAAWDEGHQAGHEDARAVQSTYPEPTPNPYRAEGDPR